MDDRIQTRILLCKIESIRLPRFLPSVLFITWRADTLTGQTKMVRANAPLKQIEDQFEIPITNIYEITFALQAKSPLGSIFRFGESKIKIPDSISDLKPHSESFSISSEAGEFVVQIIFKLKDLDNSMELDQSYAVLLQSTSTLTRYSELVQSIPYSVDKKMAQNDYYNDTGILNQLCGLASRKPTLETIQELRSLLPVLQTKISQAQFEAEIVKVSGSFLMQQYPLFVMEDNSVVDGNDARNEQTPKVPLLGLYIVHVLRDFDRGKKAVEGVDIESPILQLSDLIGGISSNKNVSDQWQIYLISTSLFIMQYIHEHFRNKYFTTSTILEMGMRNAIITFVEGYKLEISPICNFPNKMKSKLVMKRKFFSSFGLPDIVFDEIANYLYDVMDFYAATKWIMSDDLDSTHSEQYKKIMPDYDWPLLTGIDKIIPNVNDIITGKIKKSDLYYPLTGGWLKSILNKYSGKPGYKFNHKRVDNFMKGQTHEPTLQNLDEWGTECLKFVGKYSLPEKLPHMPRKTEKLLKKFK
ncbi:hypothetical protein TRFO_31752 [Tritrichomonas foetus]|uniref:Uncharacterized protein n=1 Tax=Tritrichomonas foetus TaxID=1144522 RepID=A0A1J4JQJ0_9EUKA|nr:hypothetical protein TRFO_31752 [Tritrichomonas foetus]|eukprot:OHT01431.1 hypothetical protein TRFO_31752 [Tritrichomonas foetus]